MTTRLGVSRICLAGLGRLGRLRISESREWQGMLCSDTVDKSIEEEAYSEALASSWCSDQTFRGFSRNNFGKMRLKCCRQAPNVLSIVARSGLFDLSSERAPCAFDKVMTDNLIDGSCNKSIAMLLHERKKRKRTNKLGVSVEQLQKGPPLNVPPLSDPTTPNQAKIEFDIAKDGFNTVQLVALEAVPTSEMIVEPEEIELPTTVDAQMSTSTVRSETPPESMFFQIPCSQEVTTNEQLYQAFKKNYLARGIENAFWYRRRNQRRTQRHRNRKDGEMKRRRN